LGLIFISSVDYSRKVGEKRGRQNKTKSKKEPAATSSKGEEEIRRKVRSYSDAICVARRDETKKNHPALFKPPEA
jgi:hypothetical protein